MSVLHIDASILGPNSASRVLSAQIVAKLKDANPSPVVTYRDLAAQPVPHLSGAYLMAARSLDGIHEAAIDEDIEISSAVLDEFLAADTIVIGVPLYNFTIPTQLKAWIDRILIAGQTFRYGADGRPEGLVGAKRVILGAARGGFYGPGAPAEPFEHAVSYLRAVFEFIGITPIEVIIAEGLAVGPAYITAAHEQAAIDIAGLKV